LTENPIKAVKLAKTDTKKTIRTMTDAEETALLDCLDKRDSELRRKRDSYSLWCRARHMAELPDLKKVAFTDHLRPMILVLLHTGIRRGELFSLEWRDVDLDSAMLTVRGEIAKSGKTRNVPLNGVALETFKAWCKQTDEDGLVFVSPDTGGRFDNIQSGWEAICEKAKIKGLRIHDLRHTFATRCLAAGADIAVVKELLGHQDISTTAIYLHPSEENKAAAVARLAVAKNVVAFQGKTETA
jgi:integrase